MNDIFKRDVGTYLVLTDYCITYYNLYYIILRILLFIV